VLLGGRAQRRRLYFIPARPPQRIEPFLYPAAAAAGCCYQTGRIPFLLLAALAMLKLLFNAQAVGDVSLATPLFAQLLQRWLKSKMTAHRRR
jgi:hypothetical protein